MQTGAQLKTRLTPGGGGEAHHLPHQNILDGADSDDYLTASERVRWRPQSLKMLVQAERRLAPGRLNLPIFRSTYANVDVTYEIWCFDVQGWLDQYDEASMHPHIFGSLQGYPGKWAHSLPGGMNISLDELAEVHGPYLWECA